MLEEMGHHDRAQVRLFSRPFAQRVIEKPSGLTLDVRPVLFRPIPFLLRLPGAQLRDGIKPAP
jgi:hypothetical protein